VSLIERKNFSIGKVVGFSEGKPCALFVHYGLFVILLLYD